jgi:hypothetical protein
MVKIFNDILHKNALSKKRNKYILVRPYFDRGWVNKILKIAEHGPRKNKTI